MKRFVSALLACLLLFTAAMAEPVMTDQEIQFMECSFGETFGQMRQEQFLRHVTFYRGRYNARLLADANQPLAGWWIRQEDKMPWCFSCRTPDDPVVAGHNTTATLWYVYPVENGTVNYSEKDAVFYAGQYEFHNGNMKEIFKDLQQKLVKVYGEAYYVGDDLSAVLGDFPVQEEFKEQADKIYSEMKEAATPNYAVWKSSVNGAVLVLANYQQNGQYHTVLSYISMEGEAYFDQLWEIGKETYEPEVTADPGEMLDGL